MAKTYQPDELATRVFKMLMAGIAIEIAAMVYLGF
jgi:hypothetical protein